MWGSYPRVRPRRLRLSRALRSLVAEARLHPSQLMLPVFVNEALKQPRSIDAMPWLEEYPPRHHSLIRFIQSAMDTGVKAFLLFGEPRVKDSSASRAYASDGPVQQAIRYVRRELGWEPVLAADLCICGYHEQGHCGLPHNGRRGVVVDNDSTLDLYRKIALSQAEAGADIIAPSGMMDGQVSAIRDSLENEGFWDVAIMSYSAKYASAFYGPFRDVMHSAPRWGDRRSYQMDPRNAMEALKEVALDIEEGADIVMVKPALSYLDIIRLVKEEFPHMPLAAYNVSGEAVLIELASREGVAPREQLLMEILYSIRRAGADIIITYHAIEAANLINDGSEIF